MRTGGQLKHWLRRNDSGLWGDDPDGTNDVEVLRSTDIALDGSWRISDPALRSVSPRDRLRKTLELGDLVVVTSSGSEAHLGKAAIVDESVAARGSTFANFVQRLTTRADADPRYVRYLLSSKRTREEMAVLGNTTTGLRNLNGSILGALSFPGLSAPEQRAIADYLDAETARLDALVAKKRQLIRLIDERRWRAFDEHVERSRAPLVALRRVLTFLTDGPFGSAFSSADYVEQGLAVVRLGNIGFADFRGRELAYLPAERWAEFTRYTIRKGDLLVAGLGDDRNHAGRACVAPDLGPAIVKGKCFCGRIDRGRAIPEFVALACSAPSAAGRFGLATQGSTRKMINLEIFREMLIALPTLHQQAEIVRNVRDLWHTMTT